MEKLFSLEELREIQKNKYYVTSERLAHFLNHKYNISEREAIKAYNLFVKFPFSMYINKEDDKLIIEKILPLICEYVKDISNTHIRLNNKTETKNISNTKLLVYKEKGESHFKEFEFNISNPQDIFIYSEILKRDCEELILLIASDRYYGKDEETNKDKTIYFFEGDIFTTHDKFWDSKHSNLYVCQQNGTFKKLLYIKGEGYMLNNKLNIEEKGSYNFHVLTLHEWKKIGNIYVDCGILKD